MKVHLGGIDAFSLLWDVRAGNKAKALLAVEVVPPVLSLPQVNQLGIKAHEDMNSSFDV